MTPSRFEPSLSADDPRVSEWLDGRLPEAEAVEIARLVAASAEVTRLVDDLRRQKAAVAALPVSPPPVGFVQDVLAALDTAGETAGDDAEVEEEWRRIERERLEEEIAEARADAAAPVDEPLRHRWPWLALAGALAAGVLATLVINRPGGPGDRDVALVEREQREKDKAKLAATEARRGDTDAVQDEWLPDDAAAGEAADRNASADKVTGLAASAPERTLAAKPQTLERGRAPMEKMDGASEFAGEGGAEALAEKARMAPPAASAAPAAAQARGAQAAGGGIGGGGSGKEPQVRSVTYRIRTAADRQRLESLLAASGRMTMDRANRKLLEKSEGVESLRMDAATDGVAKALEAPEAARRRGGPGGPPSERIAISGPADVMARLAAALEASPATEAEAGADAKQAKNGLPAEPAAKPAAEAPTEITLVIVVVDESGAAVEDEEGRP
jgi:hypothetical protein